jgi:RNA polymerase sigma factor (sigma-70 family)
MFDRHQPTVKDLQRARDEFRGMLERRTKEPQWQKFFSENPYVLSLSLPLRLAPQDIIPMGRPGLSEPDFVFFAKGLGPLPTYGVIEIKRPDSKIVSVARSNAAILSRDAETAIQQATNFSRTHQEWWVQAKQDSILILGSRADLFVIMGMSSEFSRKLGLELYREMIEKRLPPNLRIIPYDSLLRGFEAQVPMSLRILIPTATSELRTSKEDDAPAGSTDREMLERAVQGLPPGYRTVFVLHDVEGLEHNEIAEIMGSSTSVSRSRLHRARAKLRNILGSKEFPARWIDSIKRQMRVIADVSSANRK